jgi:hypothetical protein
MLQILARSNRRGSTNIHDLVPEGLRSVKPGRRSLRMRSDAAKVEFHFFRLHQQDRCRGRCIASLLRDRALRIRPSVFLTMFGLQGSDDADETDSFSLVHLTLSHPAICIRLRDDSLRLVEFGSMHFEEGGVRSEMSAVEAGVRVWTGASDDWDRAIAVRQSLRKDAASEPLPL